MAKLLFIPLLLLLLIGTSCEEDTPMVESDCGLEVITETPGWMEESASMSWLEDKIEAAEASPSAYRQYLYVQQGLYQGKTVFLFGNCCPDCSSPLSLYACDGRPLCEDLRDCPELQAALQLQGIIWRSDKCRCQL